MNPDLLSQLRDIHAAPPEPWWPPAPGWWILGLLLLVLLVWLGRRVKARYKILRRRKQMLAWIDHLNTSVDPVRDPQTYLSTLNRIMKLVALRAFPDQPCAAMAGQDWADFLTEKLKTSKLSDSIHVMASGPYDPQPQFDPQVMSDLTRNWIRQHG